MIIPQLQRTTRIPQQQRTTRTIYTQTHIPQPTVSVGSQRNKIGSSYNGGGLFHPKTDNPYTTGFQGSCKYRPSFNNIFSLIILPYTPAELSFWNASQDLTKNLGGGIFTTKRYQSITTSHRNLLLGLPPKKPYVDCGNGGFNRSNAIHSIRSSATDIGDQPPKPPTSCRLTRSEKRNHSNGSSAPYVDDQLLLSCTLARSDNGYHSNKSSATQIDENPPTSSRLTYRIIIDKTK